MDEPPRSWELVNLAAMLYDLSELAEGLDSVVGGRRTEEMDAAIERNPALMTEIHALANTIHPRAWLRDTRAPDLDSLGLPSADVVQAAADGLAEGSEDVELVKLAARLLPTTEGFAALAAGIKANPDAVRSWGSVTIVELLRLFQAGGGRASPASICAVAHVQPMAPWASLSPRELSRIAWALRGLR